MLLKKVGLSELKMLKIPPKTATNPKMIKFTANPGLLELICFVQVFGS